tara:strand:+ start:4155 stop:4502 length:348 start_codon:yes stop_codon:yes gene_type:complete
MEDLFALLNLRPFDPEVDRPIDLPGGSGATEYLATSYDPDTQSWIVHPQIWFDRKTGEPKYLGGKNGLMATRALEIMGNPMFPRFKTVEEADIFASDRSQSGGAQQSTINMKGMK